MYLTLSEKTITDFSPANVNALYANGFLFTREGRGKMYETRSVRVNLGAFEPTSENRRVLRKMENVQMEIVATPYSDYSWEIGKLGKNFYETKFGAGIFTANKIKELCTDREKSNFNRLLIYTVDSAPVGYAICLETNELLHYSYPFYNLGADIPNLGIGMMTRAIIWAKEQGKIYIYLGSAKDATALYKLQFKGVEWWNGKEWNEDVEAIKKIL